MAGVTPEGLHFVVSTGVEKPDAAMRKRIRSHVMLGKNLGRPRPDRRRRKAEKPSPSGTDHRGCSGSDTEVVSIPPSMGYQTSTLQFAEPVEPGTVDIVLHLSSISKRIMFALEPCILFERRAESWVAPLAFDPVYLHTMIFSAHFYFDIFLPQSSFSGAVSLQSARHYGRAVRLLRERLADEANGLQLCDTTVAVVMILANTALWTGDLKLGRHHIDGLVRMSTLKGYANMKTNSKLLIEILRCDLGLSLHCGSRPVFLDNLVFRKHLLVYPDLRSSFNISTFTPDNSAKPNQSGTCPPGDTHTVLAEIWTVLSDFCAVVNQAVATKQYITTDVYLDTMASTMYNLLEIRFQAGSANELVRFGLLAFCCSIFMHWKTLNRSFLHFTGEFRNCLQNPDVAQQLPPLLLSWLLVIAAVSVLDVTEDEAWLMPLLEDSLRACEVKSWPEAQQILRSLLWIDLVHDTTGERVLNSIDVR